MKITANRGRKAISPIIATVLIIAVTLIAAVAIGGFVFGLFGSSSNTAQITVTSVAIKSGIAVGGVITASCGPGTSQILFTNSGTISASVIALSLTYLGTTYSATITPSCPVSPGSTAAIDVTAVPLPTGFTASQLAGQQFTGFASTSNGAQVVFAGTFS